MGAEADGFRGQTGDAVEQFAELGTCLATEQRVIVVEEGLVDLGPVVRRQDLAGERHGVLFLAADVPLEPFRVVAQGSREGGVVLAAAGRGAELGAQVAEQFGAVLVLGLQAVENSRCLVGALAQQAEWEPHYSVYWALI
ncbi:hypothetical protein SDC9_176423 [bioreactor metagenome]|uniref:Uncharacterized protein n=1 Tax=bioreactor metagenome TaxID=1076179 RepID=A0A645GRY2_9ZZZZ